MSREDDLLLYTCSLKSNDLPRVSVYLNTVALKTYNPGAVISKVVKIKSHEEFNKQTQVKKNKHTYISPLQRPLVYEILTTDNLGK